MNQRRKRERALISLCSSLLLVVASCSSQNNSPPPANTATEVVVSTPPFQTKEPERYRAKRTITSVTADGKTTVTTTSTARNGEMRSTESKVASKTLILLNLPEGHFVLLPDEKIYASVLAYDVVGGEDGEISPDKLLHGDEVKSSYQTLGTEVIGGRKTNKYRVVVNSPSATSVTPSETLIWIDEAFGMPIRSDTKSSDGTQVTMELSEIALDVDNDVFRIPDDYKKLAFSELLERLNVRK